MAPFLQLVVAVAALLLPGRLALAPLLGSLPPLERVLASAVGSVLLAGSAVFLADAADAPAFLGAPFLLAVLGLGLAWRRGASARPEPAEAWAGLAVLGAALAVLLTHLVLPVYYGGGWSGDWVEHYLRMLKFRQHWPSHTRFMEYHLTARPPLYNQAAAWITHAIGADFAAFQVAAAALAAVAVLPLAALLARLGGLVPARALALSTAVLLTQPMLALHAAYPWPRLFTTFLVLAGVFFYLRGLHDEDRGGLWPLAFLCLGAAFVAHYSALMTVVPLVLHAAWTGWRRRRPLGEGLACAAALLATTVPWHAWCVAEFGWKATFATSSTADYLRRHGAGDVLRQWGWNLGTTLVPFFGGRELEPWWREPSRAGALYDVLFLYWTGCVVGSLSSALLAALLLGGAARALPYPPAWRERPALGLEARLLLALAAAAFLLSFPVQPGREVSGFAHLTLQPACALLFLLGLVRAAAASAWVRHLFLAAFAAEVMLAGALRWFPRDPGQAWAYGFGRYVNLKLKSEYSLRLLADEHPLQAHWAPAVLAVVVTLALLALARSMAEPSGRSR